MNFSVTVLHLSAAQPLFEQVFQLAPPIPNSWEKESDRPCPASAFVQLLWSRVGRIIAASVAATVGEWCVPENGWGSSHRIRACVEQKSIAISKVTLRMSRMF